MISIPLTRNKSAIIDNEDLPVIGNRKWHCTANGYAAQRRGKNIVWMHRVIMDTPVGMDTDHINGDRLDNRRSNLRFATRSQNMINTSRRADNKSGHKGVTWSDRNHKWYACIRVSGKSISLGFYDSIYDASNAYKNASLKYFGDFAR